MIKGITRSGIVKIGDKISYPWMESYPGGKTIDGTFQKIINQIPPHIEFISGFLGHCGISRIKKPSQVTIGIDPDQKVKSDWLEMLNSPANPFGQSFLLISDKFLSSADLLLEVTVDPFIYLDPPYPRSSRKSIYDIYGHEMTDQGHVDLLTWCLNQSVPICISSYPNEIYDTMLSNWRRIVYQTKTRRGPVYEVMYMNYQEPYELHDYRFIGKDFRQREAIKRRRTSMLRKFNALSDLERFDIFQEFESIIAEKRDTFRKEKSQENLAEKPGIAGKSDVSG